MRHTFYSIPINKFQYTEYNQLSNMLPPLHLEIIQINNTKQIIYILINLMDFDSTIPAEIKYQKYQFFIHNTYFKSYNIVLNEQPLQTKK